MNNNDCNPQYLAAGNAWTNGPTTRLSNVKINSLTYTRILFMGTGPSTGNAGNNCKDLDTPFTRNLHL